MLMLMLTVVVLSSDVPTHATRFHATHARAQAIPPHSREEYVAVYDRMLEPGGKILLATFDYDQSKAKGPPFCVEEQEVSAERKLEL